jgi:TonB family protein
MDRRTGMITGAVVDSYRSGKPQMKGTYGDKGKQGVFTFYYENGNIESIGEYSKNMRTGIWKHFYPNGQPKMELEYFPVLGDEPRVNVLKDSLGNVLLKNGTGKWIHEVKYSSGVRIRVSGDYRDHERHGKWVYEIFNKNGKRQETTQEHYQYGRFEKGFLVIRGSGRYELYESIDYGLYFPDKLAITENLIAANGIDFTTYPNLKMLVVNGALIFNSAILSSTTFAGELFNEPIDELLETPYNILKSAEPPEGLSEFYEIINASLRYPDVAKKKGISGEVVVEFIVERDGRLTNIEAVNQLGGGCDEEAERVLTAYAEGRKWTPARNRLGKRVRQRLSMPLTFLIR